MITYKINLKIIPLLIIMSEIKWKSIPIEGLEDYFVSNDGKIHSKISNKDIAASSLRGGYKSFYVNKVKKTFKVHQLVAKAFIPNDNANKKIVNHKDGNKLNNHVDNLEWTTISENNQHALDSGLNKKTKRKIYQCDMQGNIIKMHESIRGAGKNTGIDSGAIAKVCKGTRKKTGGFTWKFVDENPNEQAIDLTNFIQVKDFPNYLINRNGDIYSKPYKKIMKQQVNNDGYMGIQLTNKGNRKSFLAHRLVAMHFLKIDINRNKVNHKDGNKINNNVSNLEWVTDSENLKHYHCLK